MQSLGKATAYAGVFGPLVVAALIVADLVMAGAGWQQLVWLAVWQPLSVMLNLLLKEVFNQERPKGAKHINTLERSIDAGSKGMPSGHAQMIGSEVVFARLAGTSEWVQAIAVVQSLVTIWQRYAYRKHTIAQLFVGFIVGAVYSYLFWLTYPKTDSRENDDQNYN